MPTFAEMNTVNEEKYLDPVFLKYGQKVYKYEYIEKLREDNLQRKRDGKKICNLIPQKGFQEKVLCADADIKIVGGRRGGGKVLPNDADIVTPFGLRKNGDLKIGDTISNPVTGGMEKVIAIYEHRDHDFYELMFDDGSSVECGLEHLWKVRQTCYKHKDRILNGGGVEADCRIWTFGMIKEWLDKQAQGRYMNNGAKNHLVIPLTAPVKFTKSGAYMKKTSLDPYVIGVLLGDGCITSDKYGDAQFCGNDEFIVDEIKRAGVNISRSSKDVRADVTTYYIKDSLVHETLEKCKLIGCNSLSKFIPACYKWGSIEDRWAILQGLMDTDGTVDAVGKTYSFCSISKRLAEDVQFVVRSLGGSAKITTKQPWYTNADGERVEGHLAYNVYIRIKDTQKLFRLPRKKERCTPYNGGVSEVARRIVGYRYVGKKDGRCITVDDVNSLYMTNDFIVTHNTWVALFEALPYIFNPDVNMYGFRRFEDDIARGIWKSSKQVFRGFGTPADSYFEWKFLGGRGASFKCEHLQDPKKVSDRFRGVEMAYIAIEELAEHTRDNMSVLFELLSSNRSTAGIKPKCVCTCNPVGRSNKLRHFLDWYIDPTTNRIIPERDGHVRYFYRFGEDVAEIAWGDSPEEVYANVNAHTKIENLCATTGQKYTDFITSLVFIEGSFADNKILHTSDAKYMSRISARGGESTTNDIEGVWIDVDNSTGLVNIDDMTDFFDNVEQTGDGIMRASADVALEGDFFVIFAFRGNHIVDMEAWRGMMSDDIVPFIEGFLRRNGIRKENFTFDSNGLGLWIANNSSFMSSVPFNNKSASSDPRLWNNLKSECAEKFVKAIKQKEFSIEPDLLARQFTDKKGNVFTLKDRLIEERRALKRKEGDGGRFEIISKPQMKVEIGHSPDFIEAIFMVEKLLETKTVAVRRGFDAW